MQATRTFRAAAHLLVIGSIAMALGAGAALGADRQWSIQLEGGAAWQQRNRVQAPNTPAATRFSLDDITGDGPVAGARLSGSLHIRDRHELSVLIAPLSLEKQGILSGPVNFQGSTFAAGPTCAEYRFDSYRIGWRWLWIDRPEFTVRLGATAKLRDAEITLRQGNRQARKSNTGFVPLAHASFERRLANDWLLSGDIDALGGGPGYAVDAGLYLGREFSPGWQAFGGLRFLDGGADNDEVYAFARFTSLVVGVRYQR